MIRLGPEASAIAIVIGGMVSTAHGRSDRHAMATVRAIGAGSTC